MIAFDILKELVNWFVVVVVVCFMLTLMTSFSI